MLNFNRYINSLHSDLLYLHKQTKNVAYASKQKQQRKEIRKQT